MRTPAGGEFITPNAVHSDGGRRDSSSGTSWSGGGPIIAIAGLRWALEAPTGSAAGRAMRWQCSGAAGRPQMIAETLQQSAMPSKRRCQIAPASFRTPRVRVLPPQQRIE